MSNCQRKKLQGYYYIFYDFTLPLNRLHGLSLSNQKMTQTLFFGVHKIALLFVVTDSKNYCTANGGACTVL